MPSKHYVNDINLQIAMTEYNEKMSPNARVYTQNGRNIGRVSKVYDNEHGNGEQVYAVVSEQEYGKDPKEVSEVTVPFVGQLGLAIIR